MGYHGLGKDGLKNSVKETSGEKNPVWTFS